VIQPGSTLLDTFMDADEGPFLRPLLDPNGGNISFAQYAAFLHDLDPLRSEFLVLAWQLSGPTLLDNRAAEDQARYVELLGLLDAFGSWLRLVRPNDRLLNCGRATAEPPRVRFQSQCPKQWETLAPTDREGVRYCDDCRREVHYCDSVAKAEDHARRGDCITVPLHVTTSAAGELAGSVTGQPDLPQLWGENLFG
jgi:hypothetical protein